VTQIVLALLQREQPEGLVDWLTNWEAWMRALLIGLLAVLVWNRLRPEKGERS
jgi:hypothetical protein